ncbi:Na(+)/H(+) antiporter subunit B [Roseomonas alkaliterrae]|uniref:Multicomponent Na+:H+ antiporter subunit B n=1 Tax=Neoroseomonas alkaliterrae TaxID=1452450 RepID=A0A840XJH4_9PROT|nr:MnhB domain-containing protein [Neoroseomonas alkaliterrae]MBB5688066.1 multicomponent Na+:H+ antiporter subunit B [Neoroseomonas alkaliterrae]MBR0674939.1 Na(+)/H(+) antiporter subunit B [Neoroseomonas alkaliterrae]
MDATVILRVSAPLLLWVPMALSLYLLLRGHNDPGGGFVGGLVGAAGLVFHAIARGHAAALRVMRLPPASWCGLGLLLAAASGLLAWLDPQAGYLTHRWWFADVGVTLPIGTALLFDIGVYLVVVGTITAMSFALVAED